MEYGTLEIVLEALAKQIRSLKTDLMLKDMDINRLREENMHLQAKVYKPTERGEASGKEN